MRLEAAAAGRSLSPFILGSISPAGEWCRPLKRGGFEIGPRAGGGGTYPRSERAFRCILFLDPADRGVPISPFILLFFYSFTAPSPHQGRPRAPDAADAPLPRPRPRRHAATRSPRRASDVRKPRPRPAAQPERVDSGAPLRTDGRADMGPGEDHAVGSPARTSAPPSLYGAPTHPRVTHPRPARELTLHALSRPLPTHATFNLPPFSFPFSFLRQVPLFIGRLRGKSGKVGSGAGRPSQKYIETGVVVEAGTGRGAGRGRSARRRWLTAGLHGAVIAAAVVTHLVVLTPDRTRQ